MSNKRWKREASQNGGRLSKSLRVLGLLMGKKRRRKRRRKRKGRSRGKPDKR